MRIVLPNEFTPRPYQARYMRHLDGGGKRAMAIWHRRAGKDLVALHQACKMAHERIGLYWHTLPTYRQAKKALWDGFTADGKKIIDTVFPPALVQRKNESEMLVELKCGSIVQLVGSDSIDSLVGAGPVHVTFSEYALCRPKSWDLVRPMVRETNGSASFISTPRGNNHCKKLFDIARADPAWFCEHLSIFDSGVFQDPQAVIDEERAQGMAEALIRQEYLCDWTAALVGSVWGDLLEQLERRGGFEAFENETDGVFTSWDLGLSDSTSIWFWRLIDGGVEFIDHYSAHGKPMSHYFDQLDARPYRYIRHWLPHDARHHTLAAQVSILDQFIERFGSSSVAIGPKLTLMDGVQAGRWLLQQNTRFHPRCSEGLESLKHYHYQYDEEKKSFSSTPEHDFSSHDADAFRYAACVVRASDLLTRKERRAVQPVARPLHNSFTLDELFEGVGGPRRERI